MKREKLHTSHSDKAAPAIELLKLLHEGPWLLFHDGAGLDCVVAKTEADIRRFVDEHDGRGNLYFLANRPADPQLARKPKKENIAEILVLHVDLDRHDGEGRVEAKQRAAPASTTLGSIRTSSSTAATVCRRCGS